MAQVYKMIDANGETRLFVQISPDPAFNGGTISADTTIAPPAGDVATSLTVAKPPGAPSGIRVTTPLAQTGGTLLQLSGDSGAANLAIFGGGANGYMYWTSDNAAPIIVCNAAPADALIDSSGVSLWFDDTNGAASLMLKAKQADGTVKTGRVTVALPTSGALSTVQLVTATGAQISTTRDAETVTPCTFNPGAATTATVTVALSPDNVTYSTLAVVTEPAGVALDGTILPINVRVPAGWYLKLTVNAQAVLGVTTYY